MSTPETKTAALTDEPQASAAEPPQALAEEQALAGPLAKRYLLRRRNQVAAILFLVLVVVVILLGLEWFLNTKPDLTLPPVASPPPAQILEQHIKLVNEGATDTIHIET